MDKLRETEGYPVSDQGAHAVLAAIVDGETPTLITLEDLVVIKVNLEQPDSGPRRNYKSPQQIRQLVFPYDAADSTKNAMGEHCARCSCGAQSAALKCTPTRPP